MVLLCFQAAAQVPKIPGQELVDGVVTDPERALTLRPHHIHASAANGSTLLNHQHSAEDGIGGTDLSRRQCIFAGVGRNPPCACIASAGDEDAAICLRQVATDCPHGHDRSAAEAIDVLEHLCDGRGDGK